MEIKQLPEHISASQLGNFLFCPLLYKLNYGTDLIEDDGNVYTLFGSAIHEALALNFDWQMLTGNILTWEQMYSKFLEVFDGNFDKVDCPPYANVDLMKQQAENSLKAYMKEKAPNIKPVNVELEFEIALNSCPVTIKGFIDLIDDEDGDVIVDHKTVGKSSDKEWTQEAVDNNIQLTMYAIAYRKLFNKKEKALAIDVYPRDNIPIFRRIYTTRTEEQVLQVLTLLEKFSRCKENDFFYANISRCKECRLKDKCPKR